LASDFVGHQHDRLSALAQHIGERLVGRRQPGLRVHDKQGDIGFLNCGLGLRPHAALKRVGSRLLETGRIDNREPQINKLGVSGTPVARDARRVIDKRQLRFQPAG